MNSFLFILLCVLSCSASVVKPGNIRFAEGQKMERSPLQSAIDGFTLDFLKKQVNSMPKDNVFFSPLSIEVAFSLLMGGSRGATRDEILKTLHLNSITNSESIHSEFGKLSSNYSKEGADSTILNSNLLAISKNISVNSDFKQLAGKYLAEVTSENFSEPAKVQEKINSWVAQKTKNLIPKLLSQPPSEETMMMILNTIYFRGKWVGAFKPIDTKRENFTNADESISKVQLMNRHGVRLPYLEVREEKYEILEIPYKDSISMYIFLTKENNKLVELISKLNDTKLINQIESLSPISFSHISIPKFKLEREYTLHTVLPDMGMRKVFSDQSDLSGLGISRKAKVDTSIHKAVVEVDEEGTVAAAATQIAVVPYSSMGFRSLRTFIVDHPFMFVIRDKTKSVTLFAGVVNKLENSKPEPSSR
ncbi:iripin-2-like [Brevipalpus obovatus]|uniref:iripin-2-like n=1 Tax=Brevipalpus obovatus TaxID=246614 RepID=UPI003D9EB903